MVELTVSHAERRNPETDMGLQDFCDWRVFAVSDTYTDRNSGLVYGPASFDVHQPHDGPTYIVVGALVHDERMERNLALLGTRYGVTLEQLQAARAGSVQCVRIEKPPSYK